MNEKQNIRARLLLTLQAALLGAITPNIRAITCRWDDQTILVRSIYDGEISEDDIDRFEDVLTEVMAAFPEHSSSSECIRYDSPAPKRDHFLAAWVYSRFEE